MKPIGGSIVATWIIFSMTARRKMRDQNGNEVYLPSKFISSGVSCDKRSSTSISSYCDKSLPYSLAGVVFTVVVVVDIVWKKNEIF